MYRKDYLLALLLFLGLVSTSLAESALVAVASNFAPAMKALKNEFESRSSNKIKLAFGSTGKHFAQIVHGAPFDAFFAADSQRPQLLEQNGHIIEGTRFTYAQGHLLLWSAETSLVKDDIKTLNNDRIKHIAIANPRLAPYGLAAQQVLEHFQLYHTLKDKFVYAENINQAYQFVASGNAQVGFIALSLLKQPGKALQGSYWLIPQQLYQPISQQAVRLTNNRAAIEFIDFIRSPAGSDIILQYGYSLETGAS